MKDLDDSATRYSEALGQAEPVNRELYNYINSKTYKSDNGDKGRELQPKFISAMEKLVVAQADFLNAIDKKKTASVLRPNTRKHRKIPLLTTASALSTT